MNIRRPMLRADWVEALFVHFRADATSLQRQVPLELDRFAGDAFVSLAAFTQQRLRPTVGGRVAGWLSGPVASHEFLNVRTYVRADDGTRGIFFLAEWIPNRLAAFLGPRMYGLPYRLGRLNYDAMRREVIASGRRLAFGATLASRSLRRCDEGTLDHFLLERYTAFTHRRGMTRRFDVSHEPWPTTRAEIKLTESRLLPLTGEWWREAELVCAHYSPGVHDVYISSPRRCPVGIQSTIEN